MNTADHQRQQIEQAQAHGFKPGACYWRDNTTLMVEITPGNYVNEAAALKLGAQPREDAR